MKYMTEAQRSECQMIIHGAAVIAGGAGAAGAQLPCSDHLAIVPIQIGMIISLGRVFDKTLTKSAAAALLSSAVATTAGRAISEVIVGWVPILGNIINASTAFSITETIGWMIADDFSKQDSRKEIEEEFEEQYNQYFANGTI